MNCFESLLNQMAEMVATYPELQPAVSEVVWIGGPPGQAWGIPFIPRFKKERIDTIFMLYAVLQKGTLREINNEFQLSALLFFCLCIYLCLFFILRCCILHQFIHLCRSLFSLSDYQSA